MSRFADTCRVFKEYGSAALVLLFLGIAASAQEPGRRRLEPAAGSGVRAPGIRTVEPSLLGVGSRIRIRGSGLGTARDAAVVFAGGAVATEVERHTPEEIVVRVPFGAARGPVRVVTGTLAAKALDGMDPGARLAAIAGAAAGSEPFAVAMINAMTEPAAKLAPLEDGGLRFVRNRLVVDLASFAGLEVAATIASRIAGRVAGFVAVTNSYVIDLATVPADAAALHALMDAVRRMPSVDEVWPDLVLDHKQWTVADADVVDRYRQSTGASLNGRMDAWAHDRIQAPAAWNLVARFAPALTPVKVAVMDTGCSHTHPEFSGVNLLQVVPTVDFVAATSAANTIAGGFVEAPYALGDSDATFGHGTLVSSLIGARNGQVIGANVQGDRGVNGILSGTGWTGYSLQVFPARTLWPARVGDPADAWTVTEFLATINAAALTGARVMNASWGQPFPINPVDPNPASMNDPQDHVRVSLRKIAHQLVLFQNQILLCVAAGNEAENVAAQNYNAGEVTPFEDLNLNNVLDPGEDLNANGILDRGNYVAASLGTLPNVITVGAIGGPDLDPGAARNWARDDKRAAFSNSGSQSGGTDVVVRLAAPGVDVFGARSGGAGTITIGGAAYGIAAGTSFSTPLVAGSAALLFAISPALTPTQVKTRLIASSLPGATTTGAGAATTWNTLKIGAAVRQLLVDRGTITNDAPYTGTSKAVPPVPYSTGGMLYCYEFRQNPTTRRSEWFATTPVVAPSNGLSSLTAVTSYAYPPSQPSSISLSPSGRKVAYFGRAGPAGGYGVIEKDLVTAVLAPLIVPPVSPTGPAELEDCEAITYSCSDGLEYAPDGQVLSAWLVNNTACGVWQTVQLLRGAALHGTGVAPSSSHAYWWYLQMAARPDNKSLYLRLRMYDHFLTMSGGSCYPNQSLGPYIAAGRFPYPAAIVTIPNPVSIFTPLGDLPFTKPRWSPDGKLVSGYVGLNPNPTFEVRRELPVSTSTLAWTATGPQFSQTAWSPDGSEVIAHGNAYRRDGTNATATAVSPVSWSW